MKKRFIALVSVLALTFSMTVCAGSPEDLAKTAEIEGKSVTEYSANAIVDTPLLDNEVVIAQGHGSIINGAASNATFTVNRAASGTAVYAQSQAKAVGGTVLNVVDITAPGVNFTTAEVNFTVTGVKAGDTIKVYKAVNGLWQEAEVLAVADNSVTLKLNSVGIYNFVKIQ